MDEKVIDTQAALQFGWDTLKNNFTLFLKLIAVLIVISLVPAIVVGKIAESTGPVLRFVLQFIQAIWQAILGMGVLKICLKFYDRQQVDISDLWSCLPLTLDYIVTKFLYTLIVTG